MSEGIDGGKAQQDFGLKLVNQLQVYLKSLHTYTANNTMVIRALNNLYESLHGHFQQNPSGSLQIQLLPEETFFNSRLLPIALKDFDRVRDLTDDLRTLGVGEVVFDARVSQQSLKDLATSIHSALHTANHELQRSFDGIQLNELTSSAVGSTQREAYQLCVWLFAGLLDGLDGFSDLVAEGRTPTMVPFMRHSRLVVDLAEERGSVLQHLCFARGDGEAANRSHIVACRTILAIQFLRHHGRNRSQLMSIGLASILDRATCGTPPEEVFNVLSAYTTLSDLAPRVMLAVRDLELARRSQPGTGPYGQTLYILERMMELVHGETPISVQDLSDSLRAEFSTASNIVEALLEWLGDVPVGSVTEHRRLGDVLIFDHGENGNDVRVIPFDDLTLEEVVDLGSVSIKTPLVFGSRRSFAVEEPDLLFEY